jgi:zinc/manganese transport system permease protein
VRVLFGSIFGLSRGDALVAAAIGGATVVGLLAIARPLLFASLDPEVARSRGVPVPALGIGFLVLLGVVAGEATVAVGALLLLGLLAAPAGAARMLTDRPWAGLAVSGALALVSMWVGLAASYWIPSLPPSSAVIAAAILTYAGAAVWSKVRRRRFGEPPTAGEPSNAHALGMP